MGVDLPRRLNQLGQGFQGVLVRGKSRVLYQIAIDNRILVVSSLNLIRVDTWRAGKDVQEEGRTQNTGLSATVSLTSEGDATCHTRSPPTRRGSLRVSVLESRVRCLTTSGCSIEAFRQEASAEMAAASRSRLTHPACRVPAWASPAEEVPIQLQSLGTIAAPPKTRSMMDGRRCDQE